MKRTHFDGVVRLGLAEPEDGYITLPEIDRLFLPAPHMGQAFHSSKLLSIQVERFWPGKDRGLLPVM